MSTSLDWRSYYKERPIFVYIVSLYPLPYFLSLFFKIVFVYNIAAFVWVRKILSLHNILILPATLYYNTGLSKAGVAQQAEQLICNQQVAGSSPITSSGERFPSGQRGQTVNLLSQTSEVRILPSPPLNAGRDGRGRTLGSGAFERGFVGVAGLGRAYTARTGNSKLFTMAGIAQLARASAFQAEGRGFESRFPLQKKSSG